MFEKGRARLGPMVGRMAGRSYGVATVAQGAIGLTSDDPDTREDMALGAATTLLGALGQVVSPMVSSSAPERFSEMKESTPEERLDKLARGEDLLKQCAAREREGRSWRSAAPSQGP
ncbi:MAG: hypothetical protein MZV49_00480 [Rhodopseudomonas palustris]|nr:hypothetical protein [Rhodopseudomonas palustris]